jgi:hypothetical protein
MATLFDTMTSRAKTFLQALPAAAYWFWLKVASAEGFPVMAASVPAPHAASAGEKPAIDQEPEHTGTVASSGVAIVSYPEVEVIVVPAPVDAAPVEPTAQSDD